MGERPHSWSAGRVRLRQCNEAAPGWRERVRSDLVLCKTFGWSWQALMATPADVVAYAVEVVNDWHAAEAQGAGGAPPAEWPE